MGTDSRVAKLTRPGEPSLNLENFDLTLPPDWEADVLHEFGHAIGFLHEHQRPTGGCHFRFDDDKGYVLALDPITQRPIANKKRNPGLYTLLSFPPSEWSREMVDASLRGLRESRSFIQSRAFDRKSIMLYHLPDRMFYEGRDSGCFMSGRTSPSRTETRRS